MAKEDRPLSELGVLLDDARLATGQPTIVFLRQRGLNFRTWHQLLYGLPAPGGGRHREHTVMRYARAAGVDEQKALQVARRTFDKITPPPPMTKLGAALYEGQLATGMEVRTFIAAHNLSITTWYRLIHGGDSPPKRDTVRRYAQAAGVDADEALRLAELDRRKTSSS